MKKSGIHTLLNIFYYYYFVLAILNLIFIFFNIDILFKITTFIMVISMFIELFLGYIRGCFGIIGYIISIVIFTMLTDNILLGISLGLSIIHIIYIFINFVFTKFIYWLDKLIKKK